jgi:hypothetical protein
VRFIGELTTADRQQAVNAARFGHKPTRFAQRRPLLGLFATKPPSCKPLAIDDDASRK